MPLDKHKSKKAISHNIETEQNAGKPHDQAVAIALHTAHPNEKGYAEGGEVGELDQLLNAPKLNPMAEDQAQPGIGEITVGVQSDPKDNFFSQVGQGTTEGVNHDLDAVKEFLMKMYASKGIPEAGSTLGTDTTGLQGLANKAAGVDANAPSRGYAKGGEIESDEEHFLKTGMSLPPKASKQEAEEQFLQTGMSPERHYADGGSVDPNEITDTSGIDALAAGQQPPIQFNPSAGLPPAPPQAPIQAPNNAISAYLGQQKQELGKYGPEQQMEVAKQILQQQNGFRGTAANALAGLGDAIATGVGRTANPGFQQNLQNRQNTQAELQLNALKGAREANVQNVEQGQKLDAMDPNSKLSKASQQSNGLFLSALGFDPKTISMMSASQIPEAISTIKDLGIKDRELAVAKFKAQIEANQLAETSKHNRAEESAKTKELTETSKEHGVQAALKGEEIQSGQLEKLATEPITSRLSNLVGLNPAQSKLQQEAGVKPMSLTNPFPHPQDDQAIQWANAHPNDPRAAKIKALHGLR